MDPITIPPRAAEQIAALVAQRQQAEQALAAAVQLLAAALGVPDGWGLQLQPDGAMQFCAPPPPAQPAPAVEPS